MSRTRRVIQAEDLQRLYPPLPEAFAQKMDRLLYTLPRRRVRPVPKKRAGPGLAGLALLAAALVLIALRSDDLRRLVLPPEDARSPHQAAWTATDEALAARLVLDPSQQADVDGTAGTRPGDMTRAEAIAIAREALGTRVAPEDVRAMDGEETYYYPTENGDWLWGVVLGRRNPNQGDMSWLYRVELDAASRELEVLIRLEGGAVETAEPTQTKTYTYGKPGGEELPPSEALRLALVACGVKPEPSDGGGSAELIQFVSFYADSPYGPLWRVDLWPKLLVNPAYSVQLDARTGQVMALYRLRQRPMVLMTETDAQPFATMAPTIPDLEVERGPFQTWTLAEQAAADPSMYGVPGEGDLTQEEALTIALAALEETYQVEMAGANINANPNRYFQGFAYDAYFRFVVTAADFTTPYWLVDFYHAQDTTALQFEVVVGAKDGKVLYTCSSEAGDGNG